jgi:HEAT repeat protein
MQDSIEGLDSIEWRTLSHALGDAGDTPTLLKGLLSDRAEERKEAQYQLLTTIWHQGTIYEASIYAVPFLIKMLSSSSTPERENIALLVASLANGQSYLEVNALIDEESERTWRKILSEQGKDFDLQLAQERDGVRSMREAVAPHLELLYEYLDHDESELRLSVAEALGNYPGRAKKSITMLKQALKSESEEYVRDVLSGSIALLEG